MKSCTCGGTLFVAETRGADGRGFLRIARNIRRKLKLPKNVEMQMRRYCCADCDARKVSFELAVDSLGDFEPAPQTPPVFGSQAERNAVIVAVEAALKPFKVPSAERKL